jgi:hypothetical protein
MQVAVSFTGRGEHEPNYVDPHGDNPWVIGIIDVSKISPDSP